MDQIVQHKNLEEDWGRKSLAFQMANIGSEVSRAIKNRNKPKRFQGAFERALELFDLTISDAAKKKLVGPLKEICRAREEFCDFFNDNYYGSTSEKLLRYYDGFATIL